MKDPLQIEQSPDEVLGVDGAASRQDLDRALVAALRRKVPAHKAKAAHDALRDPVERAWHQLTRYRDDFLAQLNPNPLRDTTCLQSGKRSVTASAWEQQLQSNFPDLSVAHSLAVLWYHSALDFDQSLASKLQGDSRAGATPKTEVESYWGKVSALWSMLIETPELWQDGLGLVPAQAEQLKRKFREMLHNRLLDQAQRLSAYDEIAAQYRKLGLALTMELDTAKAVGEYGARTAKGKIRAGVMMLRQMGMLDRIRSLVDDSLRKSPENGQLLKLQRLLSPHLPVSLLIQNGKPDEALKEIAKLSGKEQSSAEVVRLRVRSLLLQGQQRASVGQFDVAMTSWQDALTTPSAPQDAREKVRAEVVSGCHARATALQNQQRDEAIAILERGLELVPDSAQLKETLGELLTRRAVEVCNDAQEKIKTARKQGLKAAQRMANEQIPRFEQGVKDLEWASGMGSKRGEENMTIAKDVLARLKDGTHVAFEAEMPPEVQRLQAQAKQAADMDDWGTAIQRLKDALPLLSNEDSSPIRKSLAVCLANDAVGRANRAVEVLNNASAERETKIAQVWAELGG